MKKTIEQIINNENYTRLNKALIYRSIEIAKIIRKEMYKIQVTEIGDYKIIEKHTHAGFRHEYLGIIVDFEYGEVYASLEDEKSYNYAGDYNCWIEAATTQQRIQFLNAARSIFDEIDKIKEERCEQIEHCLKETDGIK